MAHLLQVVEPYSGAICRIPGLTKRTALQWRTWWRYGRQLYAHGSAVCHAATAAAAAGLGLCTGFLQV